MARSALLNHDLPRNLWAEAINTIVYIKNRLPHKALPNMTPYEALTSKKPFIGHLRSFGESIFIHIPVEVRSTGIELDARAIMGQFCGYENSDKI
ncbi:uncharacterized protein H6S33_002883 [Morchella sextelata]|uniref:uncharacterized protein n=1 Tax=Morchella sextelata TaxID=1174677 RepID=UPI001D041276|nr:uncharacterized protein H6S33_002883 [Morchella sextelata]KAH0607849.1 hypothetical protein H6S33_002883 [Morchella sextelata]